MTAGKESPLCEKNGNGCSSPGLVRRAMTFGCVFPWECCRVRHGEVAIVTKHTNSVSDQNSVCSVEQNKYAFFIKCVSKPILYRALSLQL